MSLDSIGIECRTDKASTGHNYLNLYERLFESLPEPLRLLEVGTQFGNSLRMWSQAYNCELILGIDVVDNNVHFTEPEIKLLFGDAYSTDMIDRIEGKFDVVIDDGSHDPAHQRFFIENYCHLLTHYGLLIVEDVPDLNTVDRLFMAVPRDFQSYTVETNSGLPDSRLFIICRK